MPSIVVLDEGPFLHYGATVTDLENLISRLPRGALDGVETIQLSLGAEAQRPDDEHGSSATPDPLTGRLGFQGLPGIYSGRVLGQYSFSTNRIHVFGFVSATTPAPHWALHLRLKVLTTFLHEVGHHADLMRSTRGRGLGETREDREIFAEQREDEWTRRYVVPYLEEVYPAEVAALLGWIKEHGGCNVPLGSLVGRATTVRGGFISSDGVFGGVPRAVEHLAAEVIAGTDPKAAKLSFARDLHYNDRYAGALGIVDQVLVEHPTDLVALTLKADLLEHLERYAEAEALLRVVLEREADSREAWTILSYVLQDQKRWDELLVAADRCLALAKDPWDEGMQRAMRARVLIELGRTAEALTEIDTLAQGGTNSQIQARRLRARLGVTPPD